ncbi:MAG: SLC13 family permease [Planctomycetota bacterium]|jgi:sodium-dependent dicarboxylate transporter 2/3/5
MGKPSILVVEDGGRLRAELVEQLKKHDYSVSTVSSGADALELARNGSFDVAVLRLRTPDINGIDLLKEIKQIQPSLQVIILTTKGTIESAIESARADVYEYLEKPCKVDDLIAVIEAAYEKKLTIERHSGLNFPTGGSLWKKLLGIGGYRPIFIILGFVLCLAVILSPLPKSLLDLIQKPNVPGYQHLAPGETITDHVSQKIANENRPTLTARQVAFRAKAMVAILVIAALFWATEAIPLGATAFLLALLMYLLNIMPPDMIAKSYMKDAVFFIIGALALAVGVRKTNLDKRIGLLLLGRVKNRISLIFVFGPLVAIASCFISAKCLIAFLVPVLVGVYSKTVKAAGLKHHKALGTFLILVLVYTTGMGGPGAPTAGARNAIMLGLLDTAGQPINFVQWMKYGMLFVPVAVLLTGIYLYFAFNKKIKIRINPQKRVTDQAKALGRFRGSEAAMAFILLTVILLWITTSHIWGLGGPALAGVILMILLRIVTWSDIESGVSWEVVWMYAAACAMGFGLLFSGAALWLATSFINSMPSFMSAGDGLLISSSLFTGTITNFMSGGAATAVVGPVTLSMAEVSGVHLWKVGLASAFASSFGHCMVIGRPGLAIAYAMAKDPDTGERLLTTNDLLKYGPVMMVISWGVLWLWTVFGYWKWFSWG